MLSNSNRRRNNRRRFAMRPSNATVHDTLTTVSRTLSQKLDDLTLVTQDKFLPFQRDVKPQLLPSRETVYRFARTFQWGTNLTADNIGTAGAIYVTLNSLPSSSDFTSLFDQYRIVQAQVRFNPLASAFGQSTSSTLYPIVRTLIDPDDATPPANAAEVLQYETAVVTPYPEPFQRIFTPKAALAAYSGAFTSYSQAPQRMWFECSSDAIQFYGLKWFITPITTASGTFQLYSIDVTVIVEFRHPR